MDSINMALKQLITCVFQTNVNFVNIFYNYLYFLPDAVVDDSQSGLFHRSITP